MSVPRRGFLKTGVIAAVASSLPLSIRQLAFARAPSGWDSLRKLNLAEFSSCLGDWFANGRNLGPVDRIRLIRIDDLRSAAAKNDRTLAGKDCFALVFSGAGGRTDAFGWSLASVVDRFRDARAASKLSRVALFSEGTLQLRHDRLGEFPLFVSPAGSDEDGPLYIAVINRLYS
jgi:hypothetical protein